MSNVSSSNGLDKCVPKLRFPEFNGEWHNYNMGQIYTERKESGNDKLPILTVSIHTGVSDGALDETELGKRVKRSEDKSTYKIARKNDLVFNMMRAWQGAIGTVRTTGMVSPAYIVAYPNDLVEPIFMDYLVKCKQMIDSIHRLSYGVTDFRLRLYWDSFVEIPINVPSLEEQNKIASFLTLLDKRIAKQRELVENLKSYKRGVLSAIFSRRISMSRCEWESKSLNEIGDIITGTTPSTSEPSYYGNQYLWVTPTDITEKEIKKTVKMLSDLGMSKGRIVPANSVLVTCIASIGKNAIMREVGSCNQQINAITPYEDYDLDFLYYNICYNEKLLHESAGSGGMEILNKQSFSEIKIKFPCYEVQKKYSDFLSLLDNIIETHKQCLSLLYEIKQCLLSQLFI